MAGEKLSKMTHTIRIIGPEGENPDETRDFSFSVFITCSHSGHSETRRTNLSDSYRMTHTQRSFLEQWGHER
jgi:hypothetical protein